MQRTLRTRTDVVNRVIMDLAGHGAPYDVLAIVDEGYRWDDETDTYQRIDDAAYALVVDRHRRAYLVHEQGTPMEAGDAAMPRYTAVTRVEDIASDLCQAGYGTQDSMLTLVTTLAAQCGYRAAEGGQSPDLTVSAEAACVLYAASVEMVEAEDAFVGAEHI